MVRRGWLRRAAMGVLTLSLLTGCAFFGGRQASEAPASPENPLGRILLLPLHNQSEWPAASIVVAGAVREVLEKEKRYAVDVYAPEGPVGEPAWFLWRREVDTPAAKQGLRALCESVKADGALLVGIVSYHQTLEEAPFVGSRSQLDYRSAWATHLSLRATLWGMRAERVVWRAEHSDRIYHGRAAGLTPRQESAAKSAVRELLRTLPARKE
jgi:hypothetical protein